MTIAASKSSIVSALQGISGLRVFDHMPDTVQEFPAVAMRLEAVNYTDSTYTFRLLLALADWDIDEAQGAVDPYLESSGAQSIKAAINADPKCMTVSAERVERKRINGVPYTGAELVVVVTDV